MNVLPLTVEGMLRTSRRDRPLLLGYLLASLIETAKKLWPDFVEERRELSSFPIETKAEEGPSVPFKPAWRRHREGQGLAEYALILALIAVVAIVSLMVLGDQIAGFLSQVGSSI